MASRRRARTGGPAVLPPSPPRPRRYGLHPSKTSRESLMASLGLPADMEEATLAQALRQLNLKG